jgi:hypothetical protein
MSSGPPPGAPWGHQRFCLQVKSLVSADDGGIGAAELVIGDCDDSRPLGGQAPWCGPRGRAYRCWHPVPEASGEPGSHLAVVWGTGGVTVGAGVRAARPGRLALARAAVVVCGVRARFAWPVVFRCRRPDVEVRQ